MPRFAKLPESLNYLQRFANALGRLPAESLNEDVDPEPLIKAIRQRYREVELAMARNQWEQDVATLEDWLNVTGGPTHPAHWILGFVGMTDLQEILVDQLPPPYMGPTVTMLSPTDWKAETAAPYLMLKCKKVFAQFDAIDDDTFERWEREFDAPIPDRNEVVRLASQLQAQIFAQQGLDIKLPPPRNIEENCIRSNLTFGKVFGRKELYVMTALSFFKQVRYLLTAPGGHVTVTVGRLPPLDFDEFVLEAQFETLKVSPPSKS